MTIYLEAKNVTQDIPIYDSNRSFRKNILKYCSTGRIRQNTQGAKDSVSVRVLENINIRLDKGDRVGLIGHNGAGKTSLLRVLSGVYKPVEGKVTCNGRITSLFNMALGLDLEDTGRENIFTIGLYLGMTKDEIKLKEEEIINFSGIEEFIDLPVRMYSTGMQVRLSFAVATAMDPEILLMDEGIGAGDATFAAKAEERLKQFYGKLDILVVASHSDDLIKKLCNKAILLERGKLKAMGSVDDILEQYHSVGAKTC